MYFPVFQFGQSDIYKLTDDLTTVVFLKICKTIIPVNTVV